MNASSEKTKSFWMDSTVADAPPLDGNQTADVAIVGSGIAGLSTAYELAMRGLKVLVLDRGAIGMGMTARTTAHLASALDDGYARLLAHQGLETARCVYEAQVAAIDRIESIQKKEDIDCDFQRVDGYLFEAPNTSNKEFDDEKEACKKIGLPVTEYTNALAIQTGTGRSLHFPNQARFHPLKYLTGLARALKKNGARLYSGTIVKSISEEKVSVVVETNKGTVRATDVVIATNSPIAGDVVLHTKQAPYRTYAIAAEVPCGSLPDALYWDTADPYHYIRLHPGSAQHDIVIIGGEDHKSGTKDDGLLRFENLEGWARAAIPQLGKVTHRWSGQVMEPSDGLNLLGRNGSDKHRYLITGDSGQGITGGVLGSMLVRDLIVEGQSAWSEIFDPTRSMTRNLATFIGENLTLLKNFSEYLSASELSSINELKPGEGAVFRSGLKKVAACRDQRGKVHVHSASCTHMGCIVHWNTLEQCWDCPCHGSQFSPGGQVLNGPAVTPLSNIDDKEKLVAAE